MKKLVMVLLVMVLFCLACGKVNTASRDIEAMDTIMNITCYGANAEEAVERAVARINELDELLSTSNSESQIYKLNHTGECYVTEDILKLIDTSARINKSTGGAFDPLIYPLMEAWGFTSKNYKVPDDNTIDSLLELIDMDDMDYNLEDGKVVFGKAGMMLDLGGIAKGYTSDEVMKIFSEEGLEGGIVNLGGNVEVYGTKPGKNSWNVAIRNPDDDIASDYIGIISVNDKAVITSGAYERYFEEGGVIYHHIIDPVTGKPANSDLQSVTVVSESGIVADCLSTSLYVMGLERSIEYWQNNQSEFDMILMTNDDQVYVTSGVYEDFSSEWCEFQKIE